jgi:ABC-type transport system substrate-binding protein
MRHEEATNSVSIPMMAVFNNLVLYDQHVAQNSLETIVPDLAESWSWNEDGTRLTFKLREGVKWHDGKSFTSDDVKCTWDLLTGRAPERLSGPAKRTLRLQPSEPQSQTAFGAASAIPGAASQPTPDPREYRGSALREIS